MGKKQKSNDDRRSGDLVDDIKEALRAAAQNGPTAMLQSVVLLQKNGTLIDVAKASDQLNIKMLSKKVTKFFMCYPKEI